MCPPTLDCQKLRLASNFCPPQGPYEPVVCLLCDMCNFAYLFSLVPVDLIVLII